MDIVAFADLGRAAICMLAWRHRNEQNQSILEHGDMRRFAVNHSFQTGSRNCDMAVLCGRLFLPI